LEKEYESKIQALDEEYEKKIQKLTKKCKQAFKQYEQYKKLLDLIKKNTKGYKKGKID
jgi:hypothetical protein